MSLIKKIFITSCILFAVVNVSAQKKIGIALSGGGALGIAHLGVLQSLEEHGIFPDYVAGTSMGAVVGVLYAQGYSPKEVMDYIEVEKLFKLRKIIRYQSAFRNQGISKNQTLYSSLLDLIPHDSFDSLQRNFTVCVTNIDKGELLYVGKGDNLIKYVLASTSVPAAFEPVMIDSTRFVDGGLMDNLPSIQLRASGCEYIIGVDALPFVEKFSTKNSIEMGALGLRLMQHHNSIPGRKECDWLIDVYAIKEYNELDFKHYREIYQHGYDAMNDYIDTHPDLIEQLRTL